MGISIKSIFAVAAFLVVDCVYAVPARRGINTYTQPDGSKVEVILNGDEHFHYYTTADGIPLVDEPDGSLYFARFENGEIHATEYLACDPHRRTAAIRKAVEGVDSRAVISQMRSRAASIGRRKVSYNGIGRFDTTFPKKGELKALVILVEYSDVKFQLSDPAQYFTDLLNKDGFSEYGATGSARQYFLDASNGQFDLTCDVYGPVSLPRPRNYYGGNDMFGSDNNPEDMVIHSIELLKDEVDFSQYDCDKDGILDNVFVFYAGKGEASGGPASSVWPHAWELTQAGKAFTVDGVLVDHYACTCEWQGETPDGIGTFCHEFSHIMGLPDLYATDGSSCPTPGEWSVMDYGPYNNNSRTPPTYSAYERNAMGWLDAEIIDEGLSVTLDDIKKSNRAVLIGTSRPKEFFLFENRQQTGWDKYLPGHGMLIWHVDYDAAVWRKNTVNNDPEHQYVDLIEANGEGESAAGASWPGLHSRTEFTATTSPAFLDWKGKDAQLPLTNISEENGRIYFDVDGGDFEMGVPQDVAVSELTPISLKVSWNAVERARGYEVSVYSNGFVGKEFVPGFRSAKYDSATLSAEVTGLEAEKDYTVEVVAVSGSHVSAPGAVPVKTPEMTFRYMTPLTLEADNVGYDSFTARWEPVVGASSYLLTVEGSFEIEPKTEICNFGSLIFRVPAGWDYSLKTSRYTDPNWCGKAAPSAKMDKDGATLTSPLFEHDIQSFSIWMRLSANRPEAALKIEAFTDGEWIELEQLTGLPTAGDNYDFSEIPENTRRLRFTYLQSGQAALALDDVEINIGGVTRTILDRFNQRNVGNTTTFIVDNLPVQESGFYYRVAALSEEGEQSLWSKEQYVAKAQSSVIDVESGSLIRSIRIVSDGIQCFGTPGDSVSLIAIDGRTIESGTINAGGMLQIFPHSKGIYIIRIGNNIFKTVF